MSFFSKLLQRLAGEEPELPSDEVRELFAIRIQGMLASAGHPATLDLDGFTLRFEDGAVAYLGNRFGVWSGSQDRDEREHMLVDIAEGILQIQRQPSAPATWEEAAGRLQIRVRPRSFGTITRLRFALEGFEGDLPDGPGRTLTEELLLELVLDSPRSIMSLPPEQLASWGVTLEQAFAHAEANLRALDPTPFTRVTSSVWAAQVGDCYDSARLVLTDLIRDLPVHGDPVVLPANRDTLFVCGEGDTAGLSVLLDTALQASRQPRLDTLQPIVLRAHGYEDWWAPAGHRLAAAWGELAVRNRGSTYAELKELLETGFERDGDDRFVAHFGAIQTDETQRPRSYAIWPPVRGLLPQTDLVNIIGPDEDLLAMFVPWDAVQACAGLSREPNVWPPLYRFEGPPDSISFAALRERAQEVRRMSELD
jgi:hypothetical protein